VVSRPFQRSRRSRSSLSSKAERQPTAG
jgi:hypothetical protein